MNKKLENWLENFTRKSLLKTSPDLPEKWREKLIKGYIKFLSFSFKVITGITLFVAFTWFFPIKLGWGWNKTTIVILISILIQLRFFHAEFKKENEKYKY